MRTPVLLSAMLVAAAVAAEPVLPAWRNGAATEEAGEGPDAFLPPVGETGETPALPELPLEPADPAAEGEASFTEVPREFWNAYFGERPSAFLIDPQRLLSPVDFRERLAFLDYHADDSRIDLHVYLFAAGQEIPAEVRDEELMERFFASGRPTALVYYFQGEPRRSVLKLSPSLAARIPEAERRRALENPVIQASKEFDPARQFETFLVQMTIRLYWLETLLAEAPAAARSDAPVKRPAVEKSAKPGVADLLAPWIEWLMPRLLPILGMAGGALVLALLLWWLRRRARYRFPDLEVEPRLGGAHAAGVGAVISFANPGEPPASQRDQMPGYLRRVR